MNFWTRWLFLACILSIGCNANSTTSETTSGEDAAAEANSAGGAKQKKAKVPVKLNVKTIEGNWIVVVNNGRSDYYRWLVKFSRGQDGKLISEFLDTSKDDPDKPTMVSTEGDGDSIHFTGSTSRGKFVFNGTFQEGFIRGTIGSSPFELMLTRLLPTDATSLVNIESMSLPPGSDVFESLIKSKDMTLDRLLTDMRDYRTSPVTQLMYSMLLPTHNEMRLDETKIKELLEGYLSSARIWGPRWEARSELSIARRLIDGRQFSRLALEHLDAAERLLGADRETHQEILTGFRDAATANVCIQDLFGPKSTDEVRSSAYATLKSLIVKQPHNAEILFALATEADRIGEIDQGIEYLSDIVAIPGLELTILQLQAGQPPTSPNEILKKLWVRKNGTDDGLAQHITDIYHQKIGGLLTDLQKQVPVDQSAASGNKVVFVELFTGMQCAPCVSADLALDAMGQSYPKSNIVVVRFHQHIPYPDGLANQYSEERAAYYELASTPMIVIDGQPVDPRIYAGPIQNAMNGYRELRKIVDPRLAVKTEIEIQLSAVVTDGELTASATVTGVRDDVLPSCRLRMAIVENKVQTYSTMGSNGIREHEFVVREIFGGTNGIPPKKGELKYSVSIPVADIQKRVVDYVDRFEEGRRAIFPPELKPSIQGPISLVAWVQDGNMDATTKVRPVLQAALIPVTGETGFGKSANASPDSENLKSGADEKPSQESNDSEKPKETTQPEGNPEPKTSPN